MINFHYSYSDEEKLNILKNIVSIKKYILEKSKNLREDEYIICDYKDKNDKINTIQLYKERTKFCIFSDETNEIYEKLDYSDKTEKQIIDKIKDDVYASFVSIIINWCEIKAIIKLSINEHNNHHNKIDIFTI